MKNLSLEDLRRVKSDLARRVVQLDGVIGVGIGIEDDQASPPILSIVITITPDCPGVRERVEKVVQEYQRQGVRVTVRTSEPYKALTPTD